MSSCFAATPHPMGVFCIVPLQHTQVRNGLHPAASPLKISNCNRKYPHVQYGPNAAASSPHTAMGLAARLRLCTCVHVRRHSHRRVLLLGMLPERSCEHCLSADRPWRIYTLHQHHNLQKTRAACSTTPQLHTLKHNSTQHTPAAQPPCIPPASGAVIPSPLPHTPRIQALHDTDVTAGLAGIAATHPH